MKAIRQGDIFYLLYLTGEVVYTVLQVSMNLQFSEVQSITLNWTS